jgi:uncharacterized protein HemY
LGLSATLLLKLSGLTLQWTSGLAVLLLVISLFALFCVRKWLAEIQPIPEFEWFRRRRRRSAGDRKAK